MAAPNAPPIRAPKIESPALAWVENVAVAMRAAVLAMISSTGMPVMTGWDGTPLYLDAVAAPPAPPAKAKTCILFICL